MLGPFAQGSPLPALPPHTHGLHLHRDRSLLPANLAFLSCNNTQACLRNGKTQASLQNLKLISGKKPHRPKAITEFESIGGEGRGRNPFKLNAEMSRA